MIEQMPSVRTETDFFAFQGGLDTSSPALRMAPGSVISSKNYEPNQNGGYTRMKGYERFDGQPRPSDAPSAATGAVTPAQEAQSFVDEADIRRALIAPVPGSGPILGVALYAGTVYAFRNKAGDAEAGMYGSSASGWVEVAMGEEISFSDANSDVAEGDTLTQGGVTATVARLMVETGSLASGTNTGRMVITGLAGGTFAAGAATSTGSGALTLSGASVAMALPPGGRYTFDIYNFAGGTATRRLYGANGVGYGFEFDGTVLAFIHTGSAIDTPSFVKANKNYLYWGQGSSLTNSSLAAPFRYVAGEGAVEKAMGDTITGLSELPGQALGVFCRNSSFFQTGSSTADWVMNTLVAEVGAVPYTVGTMSDTYFLDDRGIMSVAAAQEYGNFSDATLSRKIQPLINRLRNLVTGSYVSRQKGQWTLLASDGSVLWMAMSNKRLVGLLDGRLPFMPTCCFSGEDAIGIERIFVGASSGYVYEMDRGSTFDGDSIASSLKLYYYNSKSPRIRKKYRKLALEMTADLYAELQFRADLSYGDPDVQQTNAEDLTTGGSGGSWDIANWDEFFWDSRDVAQPVLGLEGTGLNIALQFQSNTKLDFGHTLQGAVMHYTNRRQQR
jgi:hypothetical protein